MKKEFKWLDFEEYKALKEWYMKAHIKFVKYYAKQRLNWRINYE